MKPCPGCSIRLDAQALTAHITTNHPQFAQGQPMPQGDKPFPTVQNAPVQRVIQDLDAMNVGAPPRMNPEAVAAAAGITLPPKDTAPAAPDVTEGRDSKEVAEAQVQNNTPAILTYVYEGMHCGKKYDTLEVDVKNIHFVIAMCSGHCRNQIKEVKVPKLL